MLLGWPGVELVGVTTTIDPGGSRAAQARHLLALAGRHDVPVVAGAPVSSTTPRAIEPFTTERYLPVRLDPLPAAPGAAVELLRGSIERGATVVAIGPYTNLAELEAAHPGSLARVPVVVMGGWTQPPDAGLPAWGTEIDWNVQWDTRAALTVAAGEEADPGEAA